MKQPLLIPIRLGRKEAYQNTDWYEILYRGKRYLIEKGFVCDGASVPRLLWPWMPPDGLHRPASLFHDRIFAGGGEINYILADGTLAMDKFTLKEADIAFLEIMIAAGVEPRRARATYAGLKLGSWRAWNKARLSVPTILPVMNAAPQTAKKRTRLSRHLYATILTP